MEYPPTKESKKHWKNKDMKVTLYDFEQIYMMKDRKTHHITDR